VPYLKQLVDACFECGVFSDALKISKVIPTYKTGEKTNVNNYRRISLLPTLSKVFEKLLATRLKS